jgi:hypothetical protein
MNTAQTYKELFTCNELFEMTPEILSDNIGSSVKHTKTMVAKSGDTRVLKNFTFSLVSTTITFSDTSSLEIQIGGDVNVG